MKRLSITFFRVLVVLTFAEFSQLCLTLPLSAQQGKPLLIAPTRVVFEGRTRAATLKLINQNNTAKAYRLSVVSMRMDEYGRKTYVDDPGQKEKLAQKMIRFAPRRVQIAPGAWQTVRVMVRKPKDLPPGEYRTQFRAVPIIKPGDGESPDGRPKTGGININIKYAFAISIPIIVRQGQNEMKMAAHMPRFIKKKDNYFIKTRVEKTGLISSYFDFMVYFIPMGGTEKIQIGAGKGRSIFAGNTAQIIELPLKNRDRLTQGHIKIEIADREQKNKPVIYSEQFDFNGL